MKMLETLLFLCASHVLLYMHQHCSVTNNVATTILQEQVEAEDKKKKDQEKKDAIQTLKKSVIVSAVIVALAGAIFAITKKLREK